MEVFLIRHAEAIDETLELRDPHRHLTTAGRVQATSLGDRLRWHDCLPARIWTSPLVRAVQTAELVAAGLKLELPIEVLPTLAPGEPARAVIAALQRVEGPTLLVGHEPGLSAIAALLVGATDFPALAKAEAVRIVGTTVRWRFAWNAEAADR